MLQDHSQFVILVSIIMPMGNGIAVFYPLSNTPSMFEFFGNDVSSCDKDDTYGLSLRVDTPNVQMVLTASNFKLPTGSIVKEYYSNVKSLQVNFTVATRNPIKISNSSGSIGSGQACC